jgi:hypothetical protein
MMHKHRLSALEIGITDTRKGCYNIREFYCSRCGKLVLTKKLTAENFKDLFGFDRKVICDYNKKHARKIR